MSFSRRIAIATTIGTGIATGTVIETVIGITTGIVVENGAETAPAIAVAVMAVTPAMVAAAILVAADQVILAVVGLANRAADVSANWAAVVLGVRKACVRAVRPATRGLTRSGPDRIRARSVDRLPSKG